MNRTICAALIVLLFATIVNADVDSRGCWTCSPGYAHWYDLGLPQPNDRCSCSKINTPTTTTTTKAPSTPATTSSSGSIPTTCWTCPAGYVHWWEAGLARPTDICACVPSNTPATSAPATSSQTTTTKSPATTTGPARDCWTCPAGYVHWYDIGLPEPSDKCACVPANTPVTTGSQTTTTSRAPATTAGPARDCWTCSPGYAHWYDLGLPEPSDKCACYVSSGSSPTSATPNAPSPTFAAPNAASGTPMKRFLDAMTPNANSPGSISFSPGVSPYSPWNPPPLSLVGTLLDKLLTQTTFRTVMMYFIDYYTLNVIKDRGFKVLAIVDLTTGDNNAVINNAIAMAKQFPDNIIALSCGNELGANNGMSARVVQAVQECASRIKAAGVVQPVGTIDVFSVLCGGNESPCNSPWTAVTNSVDWIGLNDYPWWNNVFSGNWPCNTANQAAQLTLDHYRAIQNLYRGKPIVMTEFGWPGSVAGTSVPNQANYVTGQQCGIANDVNQKTMVQNTIDLFRMNNLPCNTFQSFREDWKGTSNTDCNRFWGICQGVPPYNCFDIPH